MATETTAPNPQITGQADALALLLSLTQEFGHLPAAYLKIHAPMYSFPAWVGVQLDSPQAFEQWRAALELAPAGVKLRATPEYVWLSAEGVFRGTRIEVTGFNVPLTPEQTAPQVADEAVAVTA
jgi:hypothetical protein